MQPARRSFGKNSSNNNQIAMRKIITTTILTALASSNVFAQNVGIGTSTPNASSKLEISSTNSGLLIPRVALTATNVASPVTAPVASLLVYNTASVSDVTPGYYFWTGTAWSRLLNSASVDWTIIGNAGTNAATNFIGTTDAVDFVTRTSNLERMRMTSAGNLGIGVGMTIPNNKVDISAATRSGSHASGQPLYVTGTLAPGSAGAVGVEFRHDNGTQGIGFGYNTIYATGSNVAQDLGMSSRGTGNLNFTTNAAQRMIILGSNGNVGMGTTSPAYRLDLATGTFAFGNSNVRTETRNDAGLQGNAGAQSGFFETSAPVNFPAGATSWWHLIDSRHSNNGNNYAMQIAGSFFDQDLWFRKTNGSATQAWTKILTTSNGWSTTGNTGTNASTNFIGTIDAVDFVTRTGNVERMRVMNNGNVGIGTAAPNSKLEVVGKIYSTGPAAECSAQDRTSGTQYTMYGTGGLMKLWRADYGDVINMTNTGFVGIGNVTPGVRLDVNGTIRAMDVYASGGQNLIIGDDTYFSDLDVANRLGLISTSNANIGELKLGNSATNPVLSGNPGYLYIDQEIRLQNNANVIKRATAPIIWTDQFDSGLGGVYSGNSESEEGGFWANGNYAMILSPGDNDLVKIVDEDYLDNTGSAYDNSAMRARIDGNGQYFQISDARSKTNIQPIQNSLEKLLAINGYTYEFTLLDSEKAKGQKAMLTTGVLAQELEKVLPEAVSNYEGNYMVNYAAMTPLLIEAIQEQQTMLDAQKQLIDEQMKLLQELKKEVESLKQK
ncbi:MAG: hypothetical protein RI922_2260 [Bacteroidota bacterium]